MEQSTRESLVTSAAALLDQGGPEAVTLREVGRRAGVSHMAAYRHFDDKEALLAAVAAADRAEPSPPTALRAAAHSYVSWALEHPARFKLVFGPWSRPDADAERAAGRAHAALVGIVRRAHLAGLPEHL